MSSFVLVDYILMKPVLELYPPVTVTAWSYFFGAFVMGLVSLMCAQRSTAQQHSAALTLPLFISRCC